MGNLTTHNLRPRIYVACLAAYNNGHLHGVWIDAAQEPWTIWDAVQDMLRASPVAGAEEWAIHDFEGFGSVQIGDATGFDRVSELAAFIAEHGEVGEALLAYYGGDIAEAGAAIADRYMGQHASLTDYVQEVTEAATSIPDALRSYVDYRAMARDAEMSGDLFTLTTAWDVVHVFAGY